MREIGKEVKTSDIPKISMSELFSHNLIDIKKAEDIYEKILDGGFVSKDIKENKYLSTYKERIDQTPKIPNERGEWLEKRGESKFVPNDSEIKSILKKYYMDGIEYRDGIPDFSKCSESVVKIEHMTGDRPGNFRQCDEGCARQWNDEKKYGKEDWTGRDVANWRKNNGYSWHERNDMTTCDLVPTKINDYFGHLGGVSECNRRDVASSAGGDFDE